MPTGKCPLQASFTPKEPIIKGQTHNVIIFFAHPPQRSRPIQTLTMYCNLFSHKADYSLSPNYSAKRDAIRPYLDVSRASDPVLSASTLTPLEAKRLADFTLSNYRRRYDSSRPSSRSIPTTTMTIPRAPRILCGLVVSSSSTSPTRRRGI